MSNRIISVAAPRQHPWTEHDPSSRIVCWNVGRLHPANPAYSYPVGEVCICEGQGVKGDPAGQEAPWRVYPYAEVIALIREGRLVEVREGARAPLAADPDALATLDMHPRARAALEARKVTGVADLVEKLQRAADPVEWLSSTPGIGVATARDLLEQLTSRGLRE